MSSQPLVSDAEMAATSVGAVLPPDAHGWKWWARRLVGAVLLGVAAAFAYQRRHELGQAMDLLGNLRVTGLAVAIAFEGASMVAFARLQRWLLHEGGVEVRLMPMVQITLAGNALSTSLPGGAAWAAAWAFGQLRRRGADRVLAGWVVLVAGALASYALFMILVVGALIAGSVGPAAHARFVLLGLGAIPFVVAAVVLAARRWPIIDRLAPVCERAVCALPKGHTLLGVAQRTWERLLTVKPSRRAWTEAFGLGALNWLENCACLVACIWAVHAHIPWHGILVAYSLTQVLASVPITPGGLGVVEGGLTALLVAYGMPTNEALASVLLYRAVSFWGLVPIGWGVWGYLSLQTRRPQRRKDRPHPWAVHIHRSRGAVESPPRSAPDIVLPTKPCEGCPDHPDEHVHVGEEVKVS